MTAALLPEAIRGTLAPFQRRAANSAQPLTPADLRETVRVAVAVLPLLSTKLWESADTQLGEFREIGLIAAEVCENLQVVREILDLFAATKMLIAQSDSPESFQTELHDLEAASVHVSADEQRLAQLLPRTEKLLAQPPSANFAKVMAEGAGKPNCSVSHEEALGVLGTE